MKDQRTFSREKEKAGLNRYEFDRVCSLSVAPTGTDILLHKGNFQTVAAVQGRVCICACLCTITKRADRSLYSLSLLL